MTRAVVFAYHNVGVRCLSVLLDAGIDIALIVTHADSPGENIWFDSVAELAARYGLPCIQPPDPNTHDIQERIRALQPDFLFSFYYRHMLKPALLAIPKQGALNMHGSLLPRYRGRVPVNWAIIHGETETGASLHYMTEKPDAGALVAQTAVPILCDDIAIDVFHKIVCAAEITLHKALPMLLAGNAPAIAMNLAQGSYFGGRKPEDSRIDWTASVHAIHNLIRAVAPPYPAAFSEIDGKTIHILRSRVVDEIPHANIVFFCDNRGCFVQCRDGTLQILSLTWNGNEISPSQLHQQLGNTVFRI